VPETELGDQHGTAACSRRTTAASASGTRSRRAPRHKSWGSRPCRAGLSAPHGMPCSGPRYFPAAISWSACCACASACSRVSVTRSAAAHLSARSARVDARQPLAAQRGSRSSATVSTPARRRCRRRRAAAPPVARAAREVLALRIGPCPGSSVPSGIRRQRRASGPCAARCGGS